VVVVVLIYCLPEIDCGGRCIVILFALSGLRCSLYWAIVCLE